ncbi:MAG TPA: FAD-dependent oxidoreductase [Xanthobacteraceae bacterium]|jgi:glycine/D-amino acid oxidase-like deaminating enzyme|nr:FAD-dependent oxidoreductase [Xanthobacteraceae bacterium]
MTDPKTYGDSWYAATMANAPQRPSLTWDLDADVCVIGGGLAGLTAAREIARSGWSVVLLEGGRIASGASGRNTGFVLPGFGVDAERLVERVGFDRTKDLWTLAQGGLDYVRDIVKAEGASGIDPQPGWLHVSRTNNNDEFVADIALLGELGCDIEGWSAERVRGVLRSERYFYAVNYLRAFTIHPVNYAQKLAAAAERDGARIFENTPAVSIDPTGVRKRIVTPHARLRADHVILCGNVQLGGLMPKIAATLMPMTTYVVTTAPLGDALTEAIRYPGGVSDSDTPDNHYRVVGGDRLMLSGRATSWVRNPRRYIKALTGDIKKTYPQLGDVAIDYAWNGTLGLTLHRMPQIGELGGGVWLASGFGGHGLNTTAMAGNLIARAIVAGDETWRQFTPFELVWAGGAIGRAAAQARVFVKRLRLAVGERRARARERARLKALAAELTKDAALVEQNKQAIVAEQASPPASEPIAAEAPQVPAVVAQEPTQETSQHSIQEPIAEPVQETVQEATIAPSSIVPPAMEEASTMPSPEVAAVTEPPEQALSESEAPRSKRKKRKLRAKTDAKA